MQFVVLVEVAPQQQLLQAPQQMAFHHALLLSQTATCEHVLL